MDGPPTSRIYSPEAGDDACEPSARIEKVQTSKRRFIMVSEGIIYAAREIAQVVGRDRRARQGPAFIRGRPPPLRDSYQSASTSPRTKSSHVCRFGSARAGRHEPA